MYFLFKIERVRKKVYFFVCNLRKNWWVRGNCFDFYLGVVVFWFCLIFVMIWDVICYYKWNIVLCMNELLVYYGVVVKVMR